MTSPAANATAGDPAAPPQPEQHRGSLLLARVAWWHSARWRERDRQRPQQVVPSRGRQRLPGTKVDTQLHEARDAYGRPFGLVIAPETGHASLVLCVPPPPADDLLAAEGAGLWIADLGIWLALLTHEPQLAGCAVSVLHDPALADPLRGSRLRVTVQLTWRARGPQGRTDPAALAIELGARLPVLVDGLRRCGVGTAVPLRAAALAHLVSSAYDPAGLLRGVDRPDGGVERPDGTDRRPWAGVDPREVIEAWDRLIHGGGTSLTWSLCDVPPDLVLSGVLAQLVAARADGQPGAARTRVTLLYRPATADDPSVPGAPAAPAAPDWTGLSPGDLALQAELDPHADPPHLTSVVTVSVTGGVGELDGAVQGVLTGVAPSLRPWLRPLYGSQAAAFAAGIPSGTLLGVHTAAPTVIRELDP